MITALSITGAFIIDILLSNFFRIDYGASQYVFTPAFLIITLLLRSRKMELTNALLLGFFVGLIYSFFNLNQLFLYPILFTFLCFLSHSWALRMSDSLLELIVEMTVLLFVKEFLLYLYFLLTGTTGMTLITWLQIHLFFTILGNIIPIVICVFINRQLEQIIVQSKEQPNSKKIMFKRK